MGSGRSIYSPLSTRPTVVPEMPKAGAPFLARAWNNAISVIALERESVALLSILTLKRALSLDSVNPGIEGSE